jgi:hypothetical protein
MEYISKIDKITKGKESIDLGHRSDLHKTQKGLLSLRCGLDLPRAASISSIT